MAKNKKVKKQHVIVYGRRTFTLTSVDGFVDRSKVTTRNRVILEAIRRDGDTARLPFLVR